MRKVLFVLALLSFLVGIAVILILKFYSNCFFFVKYEKVLIYYSFIAVARSATLVPPGSLNNAITIAGHNDVLLLPTVSFYLCLYFSFFLYFSLFIPFPFSFPV